MPSSSSSSQNTSQSGEKETKEKDLGASSTPSATSSDDSIDKQGRGKLKTKFTRKTIRNDGQGGRGGKLLLLALGALCIVVVLAILLSFGRLTGVTAQMGGSSRSIDPKIRQRFKMMQEQVEQMNKLQDQTGQKNNLASPEDSNTRIEEEGEEEEEEPPPSCSGPGIDDSSGTSAIDFSKPPPSCQKPLEMDKEVGEEELLSGQKEGGSNGEREEMEDDKTDPMYQEYQSPLSTILAKYPTIFGENTQLKKVYSAQSHTHPLEGRRGEYVTYVDAQIKIETDNKSENHVVTYIKCKHDEGDKFLVSHYGYLPPPLPVPKKSKSGPTLRVMSFNIWNYNLFGPRLQILKNAMSGIDIIGIQEVRSKLRVRPRDRSFPASVDLNYPGARKFQSLALAELREDMEFVYKPAQMFEERSQGPFHTVHEGVGVMSRFRIESSSALSLFLDRSDPSDYHQRLCLHTTILIPTQQEENDNDDDDDGDGGDDDSASSSQSTTPKKLHFLTTHLSLSERARWKTLQQIGEYIKGLEGPVILTGDFNNPIGSNIHPLDPTEILGEAGMRDAFLEAGYGGPGQRGMTFPSWGPTKRIDAVYVRGVSVSDFELLGSGSIECHPALPSAGECCNRYNGLFASDHLFPVAHISF